MTEQQRISTPEQQEAVLNLNKVVHQYLHNLSTEEFNLLCDIANDEQGSRLIIGADSACFHIDDDNGVADCNPATLENCYCDETCICKQ